MVFHPILKEEISLINSTILVNSEDTRNHIAKEKNVSGYIND